MLAWCGWVSCLYSPRTGKQDNTPRQLDCSKQALEKSLRTNHATLAAAHDAQSFHRYHFRETMTENQHKQEWIKD